MNYQEIFSLRADKYIQAIKNFPHIRDEEMSAFCQLLALQPGDRFLDVPSGDGTLHDYLGEEVAYHGLDPSPDFHAAGKARGLEAFSGRLRSTPFPSAHFDVVGSLTGLHHEASREEIYAEWQRILKPGGRLVIMDVGTGSDVAKFLDGFVATWNSQGHEGIYLDAQDADVLQGLGFSSLSIREHRYDWVSNSIAEMAAFMRDLFGLDLNPDDGRVKEALEQQLGCRHDGATVYVPWCLKSIVAVK